MFDCDDTMVEKFFVKDTIKPVLGLGITTTIGYGTLFYSFTIMSLEFETTFGWSKSFIFGIFSIGLLLGGLITPYIGKKLDKYGARIIMSIGSILAATGMFFISLVETKLGFILSLLFVELVATFVLYEAAFVALSQIAKEKARLPMTPITLIAGFATTIFWPLITFLLGFMHWQQVYVVLALFHLLIALPLHFFTLKNKPLHSLMQSKVSSQTSLHLSHSQKNKAMAIVALALCFIAVPIASVQVHLIGLMQSFGVEAVVAVALGALIGPMQVAARVLEMVFAKRISPVQSAIVSSALILLSLLALSSALYDPLFATVFVLLFGAGQGLNYIARGSLPLFILGVQDFGKNSGILNLFVKITTAAAPFSVALILDICGIISAVGFLIFCATGAVFCLLYLKRFCRV